MAKPLELENKNISWEKAEKVVKEPKNPMIIRGVISSLLDKFIARKTPIKKHPRKLIKRVPKGKPDTIVFDKYELRRNLVTAPKKAPMPMRK